MAYGDREMKRGDKGDDIVELQMRLAGFRGTVPDGDFGPGTELQVSTFQRDVMKMTLPHGRADEPTLTALATFGTGHPVNFTQLRCRCGKCQGYGAGQFRDKYSRTSKLEMYHRYEYPGIHRMLLWAYRAAQFYAAPKGWQLTVNSGYRCSEDNKQHGRSSTNHHGKAIDIDILNAPSKMVDMQRSNQLRALLVQTANAQIGWGASNRKSLEPENIAPTWVHYDVRSYDRKYLDDRYFVRNDAQLDAAP